MRGENAELKDILALGTRIVVALPDGTAPAIEPPGKADPGQNQ